MDFFVLKNIAVSGPDGDSNYFADSLFDGSKTFAAMNSANTIAGMTPTSYWSNFELITSEYHDSGDLKFMGKYINTDGHLVVYQVWTSETARRNWENEVHLSNVQSTQTFSWDTAIETTANTAEIDAEIQTIITSDDYIIRYCAEEFRVSGMFLGSIMVGETLTEVL